jgi:hypothetical protein
MKENASASLSHCAGSPSALRHAGSSQGAQRLWRRADSGADDVGQHGARARGQDAFLEPAGFVVGQRQSVFFGLREAFRRLRQAWIPDVVGVLAFLGGGSVCAHELRDGGAVCLGVHDPVAAQRRPVGRRRKLLHVPAGVAADVASSPSSLSRPISCRSDSSARFRSSSGFLVPRCAVR